MLLSSFSTGLIEAGLDEAGRGCLAGPVVAAAVILPADYFHPLLNDSKQLNEKQRFLLREEVIKEAVAWQVGELSNIEIDEINILNASFAAMHRALDKMTSHNPELLLIDGNRFKKYKTIPHECVIKGDGKYFSIAAASILAKTFRDEAMDALHHQFPMYKWGKNKGYPTKDHRDGIRLHGPCEYHRMSFTLLPAQMEIGF